VENHVEATNLKSAKRFGNSGSSGTNTRTPLQSGHNGRRQDPSSRCTAVNKPKPTTNVEVIAASMLGILALIFCAWQVKTAGPNTTGTQTFLFNTVQFICTVGFAWFSTKAASRAEFEQSLKRFAISAYRRIDDIERIVDRLHSEVREMISVSPKPEAANLRVIDAIITGAGQLVRSSISDWGDVIGDELLALERIKRLEYEKGMLRREESSLGAGTELDTTLKNIETAIAKIQSTLPAPLQLTRESDTARQYTESLNLAIEWLRARQGKARDGAHLSAICGGTYGSERDPGTLTNTETLFAQRTLKGAVDVHDTDSRLLGRLLNESPEQYDHFADAFGHIYVDDPLKLRFVKISSQRIEDGERYTWIELRVASHTRQNGTEDAD
jgi:hypothetical protein